jgi:hypothetical protein
MASINELTVRCAILAQSLNESRWRKDMLKTNSPVWNELDRAEARLMGLSMFTQFSRDRATSE